MSLNKINIALLLGDPSGIGPELVSKLLNEDITNKANIIIIGEKKILNCEKELRKIARRSLVTAKFIKKGEIIIALKDERKIIADFDGKIGKREIAQGVLGSNSLIITLDDLKKIIIDIKVPENYVGVLKPGLKAEITSSAFNKVFKGKIGKRSDYKKAIISLPKGQSIDLSLGV